MFKGGKGGKGLEVEKGDGKGPWVTGWEKERRVYGAKRGRVKGVEKRGGLEVEIGEGLRVGKG